MKNENLIHVKLEYEEAIESKKDVLSSEMNLLRIINTLRRYRSLRKEELEIKQKLSQKMKGIILNIKKIETILPKIKIPEISRKEKEVEKPTNSNIKEKVDEDLEMELKEIQRKLRAIG